MTDKFCFLGTVANEYFDEGKYDEMGKVYRGFVIAGRKGDTH